MEGEMMPLDYDSEPHAYLREKFYVKTLRRKQKVGDRLAGVW